MIRERTLSDPAVYLATPTYHRRNNSNPIESIADRALASLNNWPSTAGTGPIQRLPVVGEISLKFSAYPLDTDRSWQPTNDPPTPTALPTDREMENATPPKNLKRRSNESESRKPKRFRHSN